MCGGFSLINKADTLKKRFNAELPDTPLAPNYNARPGQHLPVILGSAPGKIQTAFWGYRPHYANPSSSKAVINARAETLADKPYFKDSFLHRRCLILADGFYEWRKTAKGKQPYRITLSSGELFAMAGLWDENADNHGEIMPVFAIITVEANKEMAEIHERMPAIFLPDEEDKWLSSATNIQLAHKLLKPYQDGFLNIYPVSKLVNSPVNSGPEVIKEIKIK